MKKITIIGKKNVGKSSLFNLLTYKYDAISVNYEGYTRDCKIGLIKVFDSFYELIDTPGIGYFDDKLDVLVLKKTWNFIKNSDLIIFMLDSNHLNDKLFFNLLSILTSLNIRFFFLLNKIELMTSFDIDKFILKFPFSDIIFFSVKDKMGYDNLFCYLNSILLRKNVLPLKRIEFFNICVIGKSNVGKSLIVNRIANANISLVYDEFGITRDNIVNYFIKNDENYSICDTPGIKKKSFNNLDALSSEMVFNSVKKSDLCLIILDATDPFNKVNLNMLKKIYTLSKFNLLIFNKSDRINKKSIISLSKNIYKKFSFFSIFDFLFLSAKYMFNFSFLYKKVDFIKKIYKNLYLNDILFDVKNYLNNKDFIFFNKIFIENIYLNDFKSFKIIVVLKNKKINNNIKRYLSAMIIKYINLKNFSFKIFFK